MTADYDTVLVVDFGAQYAQLIARRVREAHVYSEIVPASMPASEMLARKPRGSHPLRRAEVGLRPGCPLARRRRCSTSGVPVLGICYGAQLLTQSLGGEVARTGHGRVRPHAVARAGRPRCSWTAGTPSTDVWMSHADSIVRAPDGFSRHGGDRRGGGRRVRGSEPGRSTASSSTPRWRTPRRGQELLRRFLFDVCECRPSLDAHVGDRVAGRGGPRPGRARAACSARSPAASTRLSRPPSCTRRSATSSPAVFVDTGLMRAGEGEQVEATFLRQFAVDLVHVKASDRFFEALAGVTDPEAETQGHRPSCSSASSRRWRSSRQDAKYLVQGTLTPT